MKYLSPTTFIKYLNCPHSVKLIKIDKVIDENDTRIQSMAMATGTAVDIMIKGACNHRIKVQEELDRTIEKKNKAAILLAKELYECYEKGPLTELKKEGIGYTAAEMEIEIEWTDFPPCSLEDCRSGILSDNEPCPLCQATLSNDKEGKIKKYKSTLMGLPDLVLTDGTVVDWKAQGMFGKGRKPMDGYCRCYVYGDGLGRAFHGKNIGSSPKGDDDVPMELINKDWAIQIYLYSRLLGHHPGKKLRCGIENICVDSDNTIYIASFRNPISSTFQLDIEKKFHLAWIALTTGTTEAPFASKYKCYSYNKLCPVSAFCSSFTKGQEDSGPTLIQL